MTTLTANKSPVMIKLRTVMGGPLAVIYGFADASGEGYGSYVGPARGIARMRRGFWCNKISEQLSNY